MLKALCPIQAREGGTMRYETFRDEVQTLVARQLGEPYSVELQRVRKNNGVFLDGLSIHLPGEQVAPSLYLNGLYREGMSRGNAEQAAKEIVRQYRSSVSDGTDRINALFTEENIINHVVFRLIHAGRNRELLEQVPHRRILDLAMVYYSMIHIDGIGDGAVLIHNEHIEDWNLTEEDLERSARKHTKELLPPLFLPIDEMMRGLCTGEQYEDGGAETDLSRAVTSGKFILAQTEDAPAGDDPDEDSQEEAEEVWENEAGTAEMDPGFYVLTNRVRRFGACYMFDRPVLEALSSLLNSDLILLPSSVHECMVLASKYCANTMRLSEMVRDINRTEVSEEDFLSDSIYRYDAESKRVEIVL